MVETRRIAFLTLQSTDGFFISDDLTIPFLQRRGYSVEQVSWDSGAVDWNDFDAVVIRSTWDYQDRLEKFLQALESIEKSRARLFNSLDIVRWNIEKTYLRALEQSGVSIVPTLWSDELGLEGVVEAFEEFGTDQVVIKPTVGANADNIFRLNRVFVPQQFADIQTAYLNRSLMIQPFLESIQDVGEYSLIYFGGSFSHCVLKSPAKGDFRVQEEHGGRVRTTEASDAMLAIADSAVDSIPSETLFARVDLVELPSNELAVIELELIEPTLYFFPDELRSAERFASELDLRIRD